MGIRYLYIAIYACVAFFPQCMTDLDLGGHDLLESLLSELKKYFCRQKERKSLGIHLLVIIWDDNNYKVDEILIVQNWPGGWLRIAWFITDLYIYYHCDH